MPVFVVFESILLSNNSRHLPPRPAKGFKKALTTFNNSSCRFDNIKEGGSGKDDCMILLAKTWLSNIEYVVSVSL